MKATEISTFHKIVKAMNPNITIQYKVIINNQLGLKEICSTIQIEN